MNLKLYTYNTHAINDTTNYSGFISDDIKLQGDAGIVNVIMPLKHLTRMC